MDRRIKIRHLEAFVAIARAGSLKRAAEELFLTQPTITKTLKELEEILGVRLLERSRAGVSLTTAGHVFLQSAEQSMAALRTGLEGLKAIGTGQGGFLSIGALPSVAGGLVPDSVRAFAARHPDVTLRVLEGPHDYLLDALRGGSLDLVVGRLGQPSSMPRVSFTQLYSEEVVIVTAPDHAAAAATRLDQLNDHLIVYPPDGSAIRPLVARMLIAQGLPLFRNRIESASPAFGRSMAFGPDRAVWFISEGVVAQDVAEGRLKRLDIDTAPTAGPVGIMARSEEAASATAQAFRQVLTELSAPLAEAK